MCLICTEWLKGKLTTKEAWRNLNESRTPDSTEEEVAHYWEVAQKLAEEDDETFEN